MLGFENSTESQSASLCDALDQFSYHDQHICAANSIAYLQRFEEPFLFARIFHLIFCYKKWWLIVPWTSHASCDSVDIQCICLSIFSSLKSLSASVWKHFYYLHRTLSGTVRSNLMHGDQNVIFQNSMDLLQHHKELSCFVLFSSPNNSRHLICFLTATMH